MAKHRARAVGDVVRLPSGIPVELVARSEELDGRVFWVVSNGVNRWMVRDWQLS